MKQSKITGIIIITLAVLMTACKEDLMSTFGGGHEIAFVVENTTSDATRAASSQPETEPVKLTADDGKTYYLHTDITPMPDAVFNDSAITRGAQKDASDLQSDGFVVSAYNTTDGTTRGSAYFEYKTATYADSKFTPQSAGSAKYWPTGKLMFYAYYPAATASNGLALGGNASEINYSVPDTPANQPDLMTATLTNQQYAANETANGTRALTFNHALCAIKFQTGTDIAGGTINSITFSNIYKDGKYSLVSNTWDFTGKSAGNVSFTGLDVAVSKGTANTPVLTSDNNLLMFIPQEFTSDNEKITIVFTDADGEHTLTHSLNGTSWSAGQCITYSITTTGLVWDYYMEAMGGGHDYTAGDVSFTVKSWRQLQTTPTTKQAVTWEVDGYSIDDGKTWSSTKPTWLTVTGATSGNGSSTGEQKTMSVTAQSSSTTQNAALTAASARGTSINTGDCYDLSMHNLRGDSTTQNTANCYVVNAPGYYKIPLVYGNAIKNGSINSAAYSNSTTNTTSFVDYKGTQIQNLTGGPYLKNSGTTPSNAVVIWQDVNGLISNLGIDNTVDNGYVKFQIASNKIASGNAVIAVRDGDGKIMWSWHIWVTAQDVSKTIPVTAYNTSYVFNFMPVDMGWCGTTNKTSYAARSVKVRVKQTGPGGNKKAVFTINQYSESVLSPTGNCPYYQWGRKDPFPPSTGTTTSWKTRWNGESKYAYKVTSGGSSLANAIQNPHTFYSSSGDWCSTTYYDLWNASNGTTTTFNYNAVTKSVYDPCPPGFSVPCVNAYTGFSKTGETVDNQSNWRLATADDPAYYFYTNNSKNNTIFFFQNGYINSVSGELTSVASTYGHFWRAGKSGSYSGINFALNDSRLYISHQNQASFGFTVRATSE